MADDRRFRALAEEVLLVMCFWEQEMSGKRPDLLQIWREICRYKQEGGSYIFRYGEPYDTEKPGSWMAEKLHELLRREFVGLKDGAVEVTLAGRFIAGTLTLPDSMRDWWKQALHERYTPVQ